MGRKKWSEKFKIILGFVGIVVLFIGVSFLTRHYALEIRDIVGKDKNLGMVIYVLINAISVVIAPVSMLPFIPLASSLWGWIIAGILSIIGWLLGAQIAFSVARKYGKPFVGKIVSVEKLEKFEKQIPEKNLFWTVVFLRMFVSVDMLSYALGLFSNMKNSHYILATLLGITPFAFVFAYTGTLSLIYQVAILTLASLIAVLWFLTRKKIRKP